MSDFPERIVHVDDQSTIRMGVKMAIEEHSPEGYIVNCSSGKELLDRIKEIHPDLILLDLMMPDMDGPDVLEALRKDSFSKGIPVIFLTGNEKIVMHNTFDTLGVIGVIQKSSGAEDMIVQISKIWATYISDEDTEELS